MLVKSGKSVKKCPHDQAALLNFFKGQTQDESVSQNFLFTALLHDFKQHLDCANIQVSIALLGPFSLIYSKYKTNKKFFFQMPNKFQNKVQLFADNVSQLYSQFESKNHRLNSSLTFYMLS